MISVSFVPTVNDIGMVLGIISSSYSVVVAVTEEDAPHNPPDEMVYELQPKPPPNPSKNT